MKRKTHLSPAWLEVENVENLNIFFQEIEKEYKDKEKVAPALILVPHAGMMYSGKLAAQSYAQLDKKAYDQVLILSPSHNLPLFEQISVEPLGFVETPLGTQEIATELTNQLLALPQAVSSLQDHENEHSIHIQFPFIQYYLDLPVAACMIGHWDYSKTLVDFAAQLRKAIKNTKASLERTLIVLSTDFTHYGPRFGFIPFTESIEKNIDVLDHTVFHSFASQDIFLFENVLRKTKATVCGAAAMKLLLAFLPEKSKFEEKAYSTSGALTNDFTHSVSYLSAFIFTDWKKSAPNISAPKSNYSIEEKLLILALAKESIAYCVKENKIPQINPETLPKALQEQRAVFVTIHKNNALRGCIGELLPRKSLGEAIVQRACDAAIHDHRFSPVTQEELSCLNIEVSILTPPIPIPHYSHINLGTHGIILQKNNKSAVFLPQVPIEQNWNLETTLSQLALKAGLTEKDWKENADFFTFESEIIQ